MKATVTLLTLVLMASIGKAQTSPPEFKIGVNPNVVKPDNGKLPASVPIAVYAQDCASTTDFSKFTLTATGGLNPTAFVRGKCLIKSTLNIEASVKAGTYYIILVSDGGKTVGHTEFSVTDANAGLTPPGLAPQVDALYNVMTFRDCSDAFGRRVAKSMYCIQVKIGNNSGYPLQIAGMGFSRKLEALAALGYPTVTIANNSYASTRAILVHEEAVSTRNVAFEILEASGLILGSSAPFFKSDKSKEKPFSVQQHREWPAATGLQPNLPGPHTATTPQP